MTVNVTCPNKERLSTYLHFLLRKLQSNFGTLYVYCFFFFIHYDKFKAFRDYGMIFSCLGKGIKKKR